MFRVIMADNKTWRYKREQKKAKNKEYIQKKLIWSKNSLCAFRHGASF